MSKTIEMEGNSVELAVAKALEELQASKEQVTVEIVNESSLFTPAKVKVTLKEDPSKALEKFLNQVLDKMRLNEEVEVTLQEETLHIEVSGADSEKMVGYHGEALDALQCIASAYVNEHDCLYKKVSIDCAGFKAKRTEVLSNLALRLAEKANRLARKIALEPMNPFERRVIHSALADSEIAKTESEGEGIERHVVIIPLSVEIVDERPLKADAKPSNKNNKQRNNNHRDNRRNNQKRNDRREVRNEEEVEDGKVYRGYFTEQDDFVKPQEKNSAPKFKSFGGKKRF